MEKFIELLKTASNGALSEQTVKDMAAMFSEAVEATAKEKVAIAVKEAVEKNDAENLVQFKEALVILDDDRAKRMTHLLAKSEKIKVVAVKNERAKVEKIMESDAKKFKETLLKSIDTHLDTEITRLVPRELIKEAALNTQARDVLKKLREDLAISTGLAMKSVQKTIEAEKEKTKIVESKLAEKDKELKLIAESKAKEAAEKSATEKKLLIESVVSKFDTEKKQALSKLLESRDVAYIKANVEYLSKAYDKQKADDAAAIKAAAKAQAASNTKLPSQKVIVSEAKTTTPDIPHSYGDVDEFVGFMKRSNFGE